MLPAMNESSLTRPLSFLSVIIVGMSANICCFFKGGLHMTESVNTENQRAADTSKVLSVTYTSNLIPLSDFCSNRMANYLNNKYFVSCHTKGSDGGMTYRGNGCTNLQG